MLPTEPRRQGGGCGGPGPAGPRAGVRGVRACGHEHHRLLLRPGEEREGARGGAWGFGGKRGGRRGGMGRGGMWPGGVGLGRGGARKHTHAHTHMHTHAQTQAHTHRHTHTHLPPSPPPQPHFQVRHMSQPDAPDIIQPSSGAHVTLPAWYAGTHSNGLIIPKTKVRRARSRGESGGVGGRAAGRIRMRAVCTHIAFEVRIQVAWYSV